MLIQPNKILPHPPLPLILHPLPLPQPLKPLPQPPNRNNMKLILMRFQIPQLREMLPALVQLAGVRLRGRVHNLMSPYISMLREGLAADVTSVRALTGVPALVGFEVSELAETLAACGFGAEEGV